MSINVCVRPPIAQIAEEFHRVGNDGLVRVFISSESCCGYRLTKPSKAGVRFILDDLVHSIHHESVREVPSKQWCGEHDLDTAKAALDSSGHVSDLVVARNCCMARMLPGEAELVSE